MRLFICADDNDEIQLERLTDVLDGYRMTVDLDRMIATQDSRPALQAAIQDCDAFVYMLTSRSLANRRCRWEFRQAETFRRPIVIVMMEPLEPLPPAFYPHLITNLSEPDGEDDLLDGLHVVGATPPSVLAQLFRNRVALAITVLVGFLMAWSLAGPYSPVREQVTNSVMSIINIANRTEDAPPPTVGVPPPTIDPLLGRSAGAAAIFRGGQELARNGDYAAAIAAYNRTLDITPGAVGAYIARGNAAHALGQVEAARADFSQAINLAPDLALPYLSRAAFYVRVREPQAALADVDAALSIEPNTAQAYNLRGEAYFSLGEMDAALAAYDRALDLQPENAQAYSNRGQVHRYQGRLKLARADFDRAIALNPLLSEAFTRRGDLLVNENRANDALADYTRALSLNPDDANARYGRGRLYLAQGIYGRAAGDFTRAIAQLPTDANLYLLRGVAYRCAGEPTFAVTDFTSAARLDLDATAERLRQPSAYTCAGRPVPTLNPARIGATDANLDGAYQFIAEAFAGRAVRRAAEDDLPGAVDAYTQAMTFTPTYTGLAALHIERGRAYEQNGQQAAALADYRQAAEILPERGDVFVSIGRVLAQAGETDDALRQFSRALARDPLSVAAYLERGDLYLALDEPEQALNAYTRASYIQPRNPDVLTRKVRLLLELARCPLAGADLDVLADAAPDDPALPALRETFRVVCAAPDTGPAT